MKNYIMVIDEGTTGTRALIFDKNFNIVSQSYSEFTQYTPSEDKVEHDANEIYDKSIEMCKFALKQANVTADEIDTIGITNQRATCLVWDKNTGEPLYNAIVWQDNRTADLAQKINSCEWGQKARQATGWTVAPVYSSLMLNWYIENVPTIKEKIDSGEALFGTIDTWLIWKLTNRKVHATSFSNASVMGSLDLKTGKWYEEFLDYLGVPVTIYPNVIEDSGDFGATASEIFGASIPITGVIADQHAALFAQGCIEAGMGKCTNGTGTFIDVNIGNKCVISEKGLSTVIAWKIGKDITYAVEGYSAVTGSAIQWLRDGLGIIKSSEETENMANSVEDSNGVYFVPALAGLSAPYWDAFARGMIIGITRGTTSAHIVRATLEAIAYLSKDIFDAITDEAGVKMKSINIDGGASKNNFLAQFLSDMINATVQRPVSIEATSLGAAQMAGLYTGFWNMEDLNNTVVNERIFNPMLEAGKRELLYSNWQEAVKRSSGWIKVNV
ncbi:MAG: glycerol kinase [Firmicutes bacterium HGW-Firmicutes-7]|nr:MAG: glycerol kinase [Firmicutes bacterium HGW-Firmicutes-7]